MHRSRTSRLRPLMALALAAGVTLASGCATERTQEPPPPPSNLVAGPVNVQTDVTDPADRVLRVDQLSPVQILDPALNPIGAGSGAILLAAIYDTLLRYDRESGTYEPHLAESFESHDGSTRWTVKLRDGVTFSDGTPLNADAVVKSLEHYTQGPVGAAFGANIKGIRAVDEQTVEISTVAWSDFPYMLATNGGMILSPAALASAADPATFEPIGAGPFVVTENNPLEVVKLDANPTYWAGEPKLAGLEVKPVSSDIVRDRLQAGQTDLGFLYGDKLLMSLVSGEKQGFVFVNNGFGIARNTTKPVLDDPRVGQAMAAAIDVQVVNERASEGAGPYGKGLFSPSSRWKDDNPPAYDLERAKQLVEELKTEHNWDGSITFTTSEQNDENVLMSVRGQLEAAGFVIKIDNVPNFTALYQKVYVNRDFEAVITGLSIRDESPWSELTRNFRTGAPSNISGLSDPALDGLFDDLAAAETPEDKQRVLAEIEAIIHDKGYFVPLSGSAVGVFWGDDVRGVLPTAGEMVLLGDAQINTN